MTVSQRILDAWNKNAQAWAKTVRENALASRRLVTDAAIVEQLLSEPDWSSLLDVGCGEGWLIRTLKSERPDAHFTGFDGCAALIDTARADDRDGDYRHLTYQQVHRDRFSGPFDRIVCNFSLFEDESVVELFHAAERPARNSNPVFRRAKKRMGGRFLGRLAGQLPRTTSLVQTLRSRLVRVIHPLGF